LQSKSLRGTAITGGAFFFQNVLRLGGNLFVTRLLAPELFGLMALINILLQGLQMLSDLGIAQAIIQKKHAESESFLRTSFSLQAGRGIVLAAAASLLAWPLASFYGEPRLAWLVPIASIGLVARGFTSTGLHRLSRHLVVGRVVGLELVMQTLTIVGMIVWASYSPGVLALVVPPTIASILSAIVSHFLVRDRFDRFGWDRRAAVELINFSRWIFISTLLAFATLQADRLILGKLIPLDLLGVYGIALMLASLPRQLVQKLGSAILFPVLSRVDRDPIAFSEAVDRARRPLMTFSGFLICCLIAAGPPLVLAVYDHRYADASWVLPLLCIGIWLEVLSGANGSILLSRNLTRDMAAAQFVKVIVLVTLVLVGFRLGGFAGAVIGVACSEIASYLISARGVSKAGVRTVASDIEVSTLVALLAIVGYYVGQAVPMKLIANGMASTQAQLVGVATSGLFVFAFWALPLRSVLKSVRHRKPMQEQADAFGTTPLQPSPA
jgi:O-antigen/teichoic acid export membrane protein